MNCRRRTERPAPTIAKAMRDNPGTPPTGGVTRTSGDKPTDTPRAVPESLDPAPTQGRVITYES
jgi:hypothetical protein